MYFLWNCGCSKSKTLMLGGLALVFLVAIACGGASAPAEQSANSPQVDGTAASTSQPASNSPDGGGQIPVVQATSVPAVHAPSEISRPLTIVTFSEEIHLDYMDGNSGPAGEHFRNSFTEPLTQRITGSSELKGLAAESWEAVGGDPAHWRFKIRQGIEFHNGEKFDAHAAVTDINFIKLLERGMIYSESVGGDHEVKAVDDYTMDLICAGPCPLGPTGMRFTHFAAPDWYVNASEEERTSKFVTSGPFKFVEWQRGVKIVAEPFENYWQGEVKAFPEVTIFWRDEDTVRAAMVQTGEADWAFDVGPQNLDRVPKTVIGESSEVVLLKINSKNREPFQEPKVRLALRHAIDCETVNEQLYRGLGTCRGSPFNDKLTGSRDDIQVSLAYDPAKARQLLEEADFFNQWPDFEFKITTRNGRFPRDVEMFEAISGMWNEVGFKSGVNVVENSIWANNHNQNDVTSPLYGVGADIITWPHGNETGDSWFSLRNLMCNHRAGYGCDDFLEAQIQPAAALSGAEREAKLYELWKYVYDNGLLPGVLELPIVYGVSERLDFVPRAEREVRWNDQMKWVE
ncbi:MAG: ABC transporter substrate-binding protein [Chloroflexi bacterium]|nr:ABC transporter substrate-binding protein [Chloroflexota bacterium]